MGRALGTCCVCYWAPQGVKLGMLYGQGIRYMLGMLLDTSWGTSWVIMGQVVFAVCCGYNILVRRQPRNFLLILKFCIAELPTVPYAMCSA